MQAQKGEVRPRGEDRLCVGDSVSQPPVHAGLWSGHKGVGVGRMRGGICPAPPTQSHSSLFKAHSLAGGSEGPGTGPTQTSSRMEWLPCHLELYPSLRVEGLSLGGTPADREEGAVRVPEWNILDLLDCLLTRHSSRPKFSTSRISSSFHQTSCLEVKPDS